MKGNPHWIKVTKLMQMGAGNYISESMEDDPVGNQFLMQQLDKLNRIDNIKKTDLHIQQVAGEDKTIDVVVEIFNNVNSGGTKLSKGDLALAKICGQWTDARNEMKVVLKHFYQAGYNFQLEWLLRCITVYLTGRPYFSELNKVNITDFKKALYQTEKLIGICLDHIGTRLGLDHDRVLGSRYALATMVGYLHREGDKLSCGKEWDMLLYWYVHTFLWGRYAGSTESIMAQDLNELTAGGGVEGLIRLLRQNRGDLTIRPDDFWGWSTGARFYPLLYMLTRVGHAKDFGSGVELSNALLGRNSSLEVHHIFPKDILYKAGKSKSIVNALANYTFLTKDTNLEISNSPPSKYIPKYMSRVPGAIESHWIPIEPELWEIDQYDRFLEHRRKLLAESANMFLDSLYQGSIEEVSLENYSKRNIEIIKTADEEIVLETSLWMTSNGFNGGEMYYSLVDDTGAVVAIIDLAWPQGLQEGLSEPLALLIGENEDIKQIVNSNRYKYFSNDKSFKEYNRSHYIV